MRYGIISDIHGNEAALDAVLREISRLRVDQIISLGDVVNPLPGSAAVFTRLESLGIPILRGNHEDYVTHCHEKPAEGISLEPNFLPVVNLARRIDPALIAKFKRLPMTMRLHDDQAGDALLVHASPLNNRLGYRYGIDDAMAGQLRAAGARTIVCGHWHDPETRFWHDMTLVTNGSVGVPLRGRVEAEFLVLEPSAGRWIAEHHAVPYDVASTLADFRASGLVDEGGPVAWLFYEEIRTGEKCLGTFFKWAKDRGRSYATPATLTAAVREYFEEQGRWTFVAELGRKWLAADRT